MCCHACPDIAGAAEQGCAPKQGCSTSLRHTYRVAVSGARAQALIFAPLLVKALEGKGVRLVRPGQHHTLFLTEAGALLAAGRPTYGRLGRRGLDTASDEAVPAPGEVETQDSGMAGAAVTGLAAGTYLRRGKLGGLSGLPVAPLCMLPLPAGVSCLGQVTSSPIPSRLSY